MPSKWPNGAKAAVTLTFDNMGEAADLNRNLWPKESPIGNHFSVKEVLPKFLSIVDRYNIKITYYTESWNVNVYPDALRELVRRGHEVAWHAYQHEAWYTLSEEEERDNFRRSFEEIKKLEEGLDGVPRYKGFRPPGGILTPQTLKLCRQYGVTYLSPAGEDAASPIVVLPFKWAVVDALYYMSEFSGLRKVKGEASPEPVISPEELKRRYIWQIDNAINTGGYLAPLFHPFLTNEPEKQKIMEEVVAYLAKKRDEGEVWVTKAGEVDEWIRGHQDEFGNDPGWDLSSWR
ncbi:carbohydrate esterase family 4 protein [Pluteus cervinus]|uniref:Carbohydrate esterase family 4 protein n=1 Tax=Pluteus cervinus TaxID=181527 RepID=A0ACD3APU0_9AGAR|nr:carbohydrate esterase family 4 protein [Pluteus cervinus]